MPVCFAETPLRSIQRERESESERERERERVRERESARARERERERARERKKERARERDLRNYTHNTKYMCNGIRCQSILSSSMWSMR